MNGHTNNRILLSHLRNEYQEAKRKRDERLKSCPTADYFEGMMTSFATTAIMFGLVQSRQELE